jgi:class 3 adenylate cyclase
MTMRISIGVKIFSVAVFLAGVMIIAALLSESRVRQAEIRIEVLADHLLALAEMSNDLRTLALQEKFEFRELIASEISGNLSEAQKAQQPYEDYSEKFIAVAKEMHAEIDEAIAKLPTANRKLALTDIKVRLEALVAVQRQLHVLVKRVITRHAEGNEAAKAELVSLIAALHDAFLAADGALTMEIRSVVDSVALKAEKSTAEAISFEHMVTGIAALLGLFFAGVMTRALLSPIRNLRRASLAVKEGDFDQRVNVSGNDELTDLSATFNSMIEQLRKKEKTEAVFGRYVDPRVIENLVDETGDDADGLAAAGRQEATIFFSDIAGYTSISERLTPAGLVHLMNEYFNMAGVPIAETDGLLDKFIGDAVMAFWCPPFVPADDIARRACKAAIGESLMVQEFQKRLPDITGIRVGAPEIDIRMGLATGEVIVGSIGSSNKRNFTVIGDTVNLSSRLEGANKYYGTQTLICERTHEMMGGGFTTREIDNLAVKGKNEAIRIFELVSEGTPDPNTAEAFGAFAAGLKFYRHGDWDKATVKFNDCLKARRNDAPGQAFLKRIEQLKARPPGPGWDGVWHLDAK